MYEVPSLPAISGYPKNAWLVEDMADLKESSFWMLTKQSEISFTFMQELVSSPSNDLIPRSRTH
jgi:hypothetical protein